MSVVKAKLVTQVDARLMGLVRKLAESEGLQIDAVAEETLKRYLDAKNPAGSPNREHVMQAYQNSVDRYAGLYKKLER